MRGGAGEGDCGRAACKAGKDVSIKVAVVHGLGRHFIAGADVREFDAPPRQPLLNDVLLRLESCGKPVVAALHGTTLGGGAELALASHYRCATRDLSLGFPEIRLGLLPGSGGTVRLPRVVGIAKALELMLSGTPIGFEVARDLGLVDREVDGDIRAGAVTYARELVRAGAAVRRVSDLPVDSAPTPTFFADSRRLLSRSARRVPANHCIIEAVEAAVERPFRPALARARELFEDCRVSTESQALRHLFFAERRAKNAGESERPVAKIGIVGAGTMGRGIAINVATYGFDVTLVDTQPAVIEQSIARIRSNFADAARKGRISDAAATVAIGRVSSASDLQTLSDADLVIEAVYESMSVKRQLFAQLGALCRPGTILATNTSTLDVDEIAAASGRPADVVGMHFFSPANVMRLIEIVRGRTTAPDVVATAVSVARRLGKIGVVVGNCFGFVGNRMLYAYGREKELMMLEGAAPEHIDQVLEAFGMAMGPNAVGDLAGLDVGYRIRREWRERPDDLRYYRVSDLLVEQERLGQKSGRGFYRYVAGARHGVLDPDVNDLIREEAALLGIARRNIGDAEIVERCILALVNEGARILDDRIAATPGDIDVIWCNGYGFPRDRGGPMFYADTLGLPNVLDQIAACAASYGGRYWQPAPLLERLARAGRSFSTWSALGTEAETTV